MVTAVFLSFIRFHRCRRGRPQPAERLGPINLDVPWNPAVLEQRNARVHRLGQTRQVQIITMVAADSYEQQVLELIGNKQDLFDNVVKEDGTEDVVGISRKLLETLVDTLAAKEIERILGSGGGLICVLDRVDSESESLAVELSKKVPVALIDHYALRGLSRLGTASPLACAETYYSHDQQATPRGPSRLALLARRRPAPHRRGRHNYSGAFIDAGNDLRDPEGRQAQRLCEEEFLLYVADIIDKMQILGKFLAWRAVSHYNPAAKQPFLG